MIESSSKSKRENSDEKLFLFSDPVELRGIEPLTSWLQTTRSPS